jgi:hypothetical protein
VKIFMPANREKPVYAPYVEHVPPDVTASTIARDSNDLQQDSLRSGTGNFSEQNREMELPNRELFAANQGIREFKLRGHDRRSQALRK